MKIWLMLVLLTAPALAQADPCRKTEACKKDGKCTFVSISGAAFCEMRSTYGCRMSSKCKEEGRCVYDKRIMDCIATSAAWCAKSDECKRFGNCGFSKKLQKCHPTTKAHCKRSNDCRGPWMHCTLVRSKDGNSCLVPLE